MKTTTMEDLEMKYNFGTGKVVRFKDYVAVAHNFYDVMTRRQNYGFHVYRPIETEAETGLSFIELRLENIDGLFPVEDLDGYDTEGEALLSAFNHLMNL